MEDKECFERFTEKIAEMVESMHEIMQSLMETIVAFAHVISEVSYELACANTEACKNLIDAINHIPKIPGMFESEYTRKLHRYRKKYKQPLKHFLGKHPIIRDILVGALSNLVLLIAGEIINNAAEYINSNEAILYSVDYDTEDSTIRFNINTTELETGDQLYLPDGNVLIFQAQ